MHNFESEIQKFLTSSPGTPLHLQPVAYLDFVEVANFSLVTIAVTKETRHQTMFSYDQNYFCYVPKPLP